jgi:hypothetical protein
MPIYLQAPGLVPAVQRPFADASVDGLPLGYAGLVLPAVAPASYQTGAHGSGAGRTQAFIIAVL